jgi:thiol-disulfide isomerase/thioredoxin
MTSTRAPRARSSSVTKAARAGESSRKVWIIVAVVLVVAFAGIMAVALAQEDTSSARGDQTAEVTVTGDPLPLLPQGAPSAAVGLPAPELSGTSLTGDPMAIGNDGRPKVIGFFTHWCPACQAEVPVVSEWWNSGGVPDDVDFVAVNTGVDPSRVNYPPSAWFEREDWDVPTLLDDRASTAALHFGLSAYPYWVVVDGDGVVVDQLSGQLGVAEIMALMDRARAGAGAGGAG